MIDLQEVEKISATEAARKALAQIKTSNPEGLLTAEDVVTTAAHPDHPLHKFFEWDETEAAHKYRLMQARALIRKVTVIAPDDDEKPMPKYVSLRKDRAREHGGYRETKEVVNSRELLTQLEETAKADIDGTLRRYEMLKTLCAKVRKAAGIKPKKK